MEDERDHTSYVMLSLDAMRSRKFMCDFKIVVGNKRFRTHRLILAANSVFFKNIFSKPGKLERVITLERITPSEMQQCIEYMYTSKCHFKLSSIPKLVEAARFFKIPHLEDDCMEFLAEHINVGNLLEILKLAKKSKDHPAVREAADVFIRENFETVMSSELCLQISKDDFLRYISGANHNTYWKAIRDYCQGREEVFLELLSRLKLSNFPFEFLCTTVLKDPLTNYKLPETRLPVVRAIFSDHSRLQNKVNVDNYFLLKKLLPLIKNDLQCTKIVDSFMQKYFSSIISGRGFCFLSKQEVLSLLKCSAVGPEEIKWEAILRWVQCDPKAYQSRALSFREMFLCIRLDGLSFEFLKEISKEELVKRDVVCMESLMHATFRYTDQNHVRPVAAYIPRIERDTTCREQPQTDNILEVVGEYERQLDERRLERHASQQDPPHYQYHPGEDSEDDAPTGRIRVRRGPYYSSPETTSSDSTSGPDSPPPIPPLAVSRKTSTQAAGVTLTAPTFSLPTQQNTLPGLGPVISGRFGQTTQVNGNKPLLAGTSNIGQTSKQGSSAFRFQPTDLPAMFGFGAIPQQQSTAVNTSDPAKSHNVAVDGSRSHTATNQQNGSQLSLS